MSFRAARIVSLVVLVSLLVWPGILPGRAAPAMASDTFVAAVRNQPTTLDPHIGTDNPSLKYLIGTYETLVRNKFNTLDERNIEGLLARSWEISRDGLTYTFHLSPGVKFHDGSALDAESVKVSIERMKAINLGNAFVLAPVKEVRTVNPQTVQIILSEPYAPFLSALSVVNIVSARAVRQHEAGGDWARRWFRDHEAGTGPYEFASWQVGQQITLRAFRDYWRGWTPQHPRTIIMRNVTEASTQRLLVESGQVDWADTINIDDAIAMRSNKAVKVRPVRGLAVHYLLMNTQRAPLTNAKVRQALVHAFPYEVYWKQVMRGFADPTSGFLAPGFAEHDRGPEAKFDLERARRLLAEGGHPDGGFTLTIVYFGARDYQTLGSQLYAAQLRRLGITLKLEGMPWASLLKRMTDMDPAQRPDFAFVQVAPLYGSPDSVLYPTFYSRSSHWGHYTYANPRVDSLLDEARRTPDKGQRTRMYQEVQRILREDAPAVPLMIIQAINVYTARVNRAETMPTNGAVVDYHTLQIGN